MVDDVRIIATGEKWIGYGIRSFSSIIDEMMKSAKKELVLTVYVITDKNVVNNIEKALERGVSVEIFIYIPDQSEENDSIKKLHKLEHGYKYLKINNINNEVLHAKILVIDGYKILVGSANPTFGGLIKNYELGFLVEDGRVAHKILTMLRRLTGK